MKKFKNLLSMVLLAGVLTFVTACNNNDDENGNGGGAEADVNVQELYIYDDLQYVLRVVSENLEWGDVVWDQIMLADDVPSPEMKYGLLVVPFFPSDNTRTHTRTVSINNGNFRIVITCAVTDEQWGINQAGVITPGGN